MLDYILAWGTTQLRDQFKFDIDQAELAEQALATLEENIIHTLDAHRLGILIFDNSGNLVSCNQQWERLYEINFDEVRDYNVLEDENLRDKHIWEPIKGAFSGTSGIMEENYFSPEEWGKEGRPRWTEGHVLPLFHQTETDALMGTAIFLQDITDKKITADEIQNLRKFLTEVHTQQQDICRRLSDLLEIAQQKTHLGPVMPGRKTLRDRERFIPRREREVFEKLAAGYTVKEAAHQLGLGIKSVYTYRSRLLKRLGLSGDVGLALAWRELHNELGEEDLVTDMKRGDSA